MESEVVYQWFGGITMVKERRSAKRIKYDMVRVYSKMETHVDGKAKSVFKRKPYALAK